MAFVSYAQNFEDVMLWRALKHVQGGTYVDVGAQHPVVDSVSKPFYELGWRGIHIEPVAEYAELLRQDRPDETVLQVALADTEGTLELNVISNTGLSTAVAPYAQRHQVERGLVYHRIQVPVLTLKSALISLVGKDVHWLKIDVEGLEEKVLRGWDSKILRPWIMVIEATKPNSTETDYAAWDPILTGADYQFVYFDGLNRFYVAKEHASLAEAFSSPPNVFDGVQLSGLASTQLCSGLIASHQAREEELSALAEARVTQAEARLSEAEERATQAEARLSEAEERATQAEARLSEAEERATQAEARLSEAEERATQAEARLSEAEERATQAEARLSEAEERATQAEARLSEAEERATQAEARLSEAEERATQAEAQVREAEARVKLAEMRAVQVEKLVADENSVRLAGRLHQELRAVYNSTSWGITWPLRLVGNALKAGPLWLARRIHGSRRGSTGYAARFGGRIANRFARQPELRAAVRRAANRCPALGDALRRLLLTKSDRPAGIESAGTSTGISSGASPAGCTWPSTLSAPSVVDLGSNPEQQLGMMNRFLLEIGTGRGDDPTA